MHKKIFITGCAKSGTTLLKRMFYSYKCHVFEEEVTLQDFAEFQYDDRTRPVDFIVGKRSFNSIYSNHMLPKDDVKKQKEIISDNGIMVLNIVRDGREVVESAWNDWGVNFSNEWMICVMNAKNDNVFTVNYDELITNPNSVMLSVNSHFGISGDHDWSSYPDFCPEDSDGSYKKRPLKKPTHDMSFYKRLSPIDYKLFVKLCAEL